MLGVFGARVVILPLTAAASLTSSAIIIRDVGATTFGLISLVITLMNLLPFADLGVGAPIINAFARKDPNRFDLSGAAWSVLWLIAVVLGISALVVASTSGWSPILGVDSDVPGVTLAFLIFAVAVPVGLGARILTGLGAVARLTYLGLVFPFVALGLNFLGMMLGSETLYVLTPCIALTISSLVTFAVALRMAGAPRAQAFQLRVPARREAHQLLSGGLPMFVVTIGLAVAFQTDRLVLSHFSTGAQLADYAVAMTLYAPAFGLLSSMGTLLWPHFQRAAVDGQPSDFLHRWRDFVALGLLAAAALVVAGPVVTDLLYDVSVPWMVWGWAAVLLLVQAIHLPAGMLLVDAEGLRFQAVWISVMAVANFGLSVLITPALGAVGPLVASAACLLILLFVPCFLRARRTIADHHADQSRAATP